MKEDSEMSSKRGAPTGVATSSSNGGRRDDYYYDNDRGSSSSDDDSVGGDESSYASSSSSSYSSYLSDRDDDAAEKGYPTSSKCRNAAVRRRMAPASNGGHRSASEAESDVDGRSNNHHSHRHGLPKHQHNHHRHHHRQKTRDRPSSSSKDGEKRYKSKKGSSRKKCCGCKVIPHLRQKVCRRLFNGRNDNKDKHVPPPSTGTIICRQIPTILLIGCFVFWLLVHTSNVYETTGGVGGGRTRNRAGGRGNNKYRQQQPLQLTSDGSILKPRGRRGPMSFLTDAVDGFFDIVNLPVKVLTKSTRGEALMPGCVRSPWQVHNYQNCNDMHETDLYEVFSGRIQKNGGYVGSGYWRHVWLVDPRQEYHNHDLRGGGGAVLKMMKNEHKVETRNFERHRRDALAMERLTSSNHIVDIYSYCGNSVLTEYVGSDMHQVLYRDAEQTTTRTTTNDGSEQQQQPPRRRSRTDREMLQLALQVVQGVADLHKVPGGPIVHADIADKQFLVDPNGNVKLNDFNRCRFMGHKKATKEKCSFRIPSAPGRHRSPEEYNDDELTEQLDTFSTANVLYGILTGSPPWGEEPSSQVKRAVKRGRKPPIDDEYRVPGTASALLASLIDQAYEHDPEERITAPALAEELKKAIIELED